MKADIEIRQLSMGPFLVARTSRGAQWLGEHVCPAPVKIGEGDLLNPDTADRSIAMSREDGIVVSGKGAKK